MRRRKGESERGRGLGSSGWLRAEALWREALEATPFSATAARLNLGEEKRQQISSHHRIGRAHTLTIHLAQSDQATMSPYHRNSRQLRETLLRKSRRNDPSRSRLSRACSYTAQRAILAKQMESVCCRQTKAAASRNQSLLLTSISGWICEESGISQMAVLHGATNGKRASSVKLGAKIPADSIARSHHMEQMRSAAPQRHRPQASEPADLGIVNSFSEI